MTTKDDGRLERENDEANRVDRVDVNNLTEAEIKLLKQLVFGRKAWSYVLTRIKTAALWATAFMGALLAFGKLFGDE